MEISRVVCPLGRWTLRRKRRGDACALPKVPQKLASLANIFCTKRSWSAMRPRIALLRQAHFALRVVLRSERELGCDRVVALEPNQEIKHPHSPANRETVAHISAKDCVYRRNQTQHIARFEENFDELLRVPRIDEPKINVHRAVHRSLVSCKQALCLARVIEHFVQSISAFFAAEHGKKNAAAKNRVDKSGGVACKQPAIAVQTRGSIGEIRFDINFRNAPRVCHPFRNTWLFRQCLLEEIFGVELGIPKNFTIQNDSNTRSLTGKWNQPEPAINGAN